MIEGDSGQINIREQTQASACVIPRVAVEADIPRVAVEADIPRVAVESYIFVTHLAEVDHRAVDVDPPVLLVPLDAVEVSAPRLVHGTPQRHPGSRTCLDLIPEPGTCTGHVTRG